MTHPTKQEQAVWRLTDENINDLQAQSIERLIAMAKHAHHVDLVVRINGRDEHFQADWFKHLVRGAESTERRVALLEECAKLLWDAADMMNDGPDESDVAYANARLTQAIEKARELRRLP